MRRVRTKEPVREQGMFRWEMPEDALSAGHPARLLWQVLGTLDLSGFIRDAKAVDGKQGRDVLSVRMLLTLWLYAISIGIGSAREIARRIQSDAALRWIVGDQSVGHAKLSEFRIGHLAVIDKLFTDVLGTLLHRQLMSLDLAAQDGTRVRASASAPSVSSGGISRAVPRAGGAPPQSCARGGRRPRGNGGRKARAARGSGRLPAPR